MTAALKRMKLGTRVFLAVMVAIVAGAAAVGLYGLIKGPPDKPAAQPPPATSAPRPTTAPSSQEPAEPTPPAVTAEPVEQDVDMHGGEGLAPAEEYAGETLPDVPDSTDPVQYAKNMATTMLNWTTKDGLQPLDYVQRMMRDADPSGEESAGLREDLERYIPQGETWKELQQYGVTQRFEITKAVIPAAWKDALAQDSAGRIKAGTVAVTIDGMIYRDGLVDGKVDTYERRLSLTAFITCQPTFPTCHPMRLSYMDDVLR